MKWFRICLFLSVSCIVWNHGNSQEMSHRDSLSADFSYLLEALEATHPDPYSGFGGKVFFHKAAFELKNDLRQNEYSLHTFAEKITAFLSKLKDAHTQVYGPEETNNNPDGYLPVSIRIIPDGAILSFIAPEHKNLLGSRITSINAVPTDSVLRGIARFSPCENLYGSYSELKWNIHRSDFLKKFCSGVKDSVCLQLETPEGKTEKVSIPLVDQYGLTHNPGEWLPAWDKVPSENYMSHTFLDDEKHVMLFKLTSIMARENFEHQLTNNPQNGYNQLQWFYRQQLNREMPSDTARALAEVPSLSETFHKMLLEMKKHKSPVLIVDLRSNSGGYTPITLASLYQLYGDEFLLKDMGIRFYRLLSPLYLQKINSTLEEFNKNDGKNHRLGDYLFYDEDENEPADIEARRENFIRDCWSCTREELRKQNGRPVYLPEKVYVVTDEGSFSAAFHFAFYLWKMGAVLVGVPSQQAPNTFMETTPFRLPYTGIGGSISNTMQVFLPSKDKRAKTLWPDIMLPYETYRKYGFDRHAELRYLLDEIQKE